MGMTKAKVENRTIRPEGRMVGDVTNIGPTDTAKSGAKSPDISVDSPLFMANPGVSDGKAANIAHSGEGDMNRAANPIPGQAANAPDDYASPGGPKEDSSVNSGPYGQRVNWPAAADGTSAGGAKSTDTLCQVTGAKVAFPAASDKVSAGGVKDAMSFAPDGKDW